MRYISLVQVLALHRRIMEQSGSTPRILNLEALESALHQPRMTFGGEYLYPTLAEKSAALAFSMIRNHPFIDGNKRSGDAAMEVFFILNGYKRWASGKIGREQFAEWIEAHLHPLK